MRNPDEHRFVPQLLLNSGIWLEVPAGDDWVLGRAPRHPRPSRSATKASRVDVDLGPHDQDHVVSRYHACIRREAQSFTIEDLGSRNTTLLNRRRLAPGQRYPLADRDHIRLGNVEIIFFTDRTS